MVRVWKSIFKAYSNTDHVDSSFRRDWRGFSLQILIVQAEPNLKRLERTELRNWGSGKQAWRSHRQLSIFIVHCIMNRAVAMASGHTFLTWRQSREQLLASACGQAGIYWQPCGVVPGSSACLPAVRTAPGGRACLHFGAFFSGRSSQKPITLGCGTGYTLWSAHAHVWHGVSEVSGL